MTDYADLRRRAEDALLGLEDSEQPFRDAANPQAILALLSVCDIYEAHWRSADSRVTALEKALRRAVKRMDLAGVVDRDPVMREARSVCGAYVDDPEAREGCDPAALPAEVGE